MKALCVIYSAALLSALASPIPAKADISESYGDQCKYFYESDYCITPKGRVFGKVFECGIPPGAVMQVGALERDYKYWFRGFCGMWNAPAGYYIHNFKQIDGGSKLVKYNCRADSGGNRCTMKTTKDVYNYVRTAN